MLVGWPGWNGRGGDFHIVLSIRANFDSMRL